MLVFDSKTQKRSTSGSEILYSGKKDGGGGGKGGEVILLGGMSGVSAAFCRPSLGAYPRSTLGVAVVGKWYGLMVMVANA
jgi:hypothetical protein